MWHSHVTFCYTHKYYSHTFISTTQRVSHATHIIYIHTYTNGSLENVLAWWWNAIMLCRGRKSLIPGLATHRSQVCIAMHNSPCSNTEHPSMHIHAHTYYGHTYYAHICIYVHCMNITSRQVVYNMYITRAYICIVHSIHSIHNIERACRMAIWLRCRRVGGWAGTHLVSFSSPMGLNAYRLSSLGKPRDASFYQSTHCRLSSLSVTQWAEGCAHLKFVQTHDMARLICLHVCFSCTCIMFISFSSWFPFIRT